MESEDLPPSFALLAESLHAPLARLLAARARAANGPLVAAVTGPQGSGKTTASKALTHFAAADGLRTAVVALDDFYLTRSERQRLAAEVHPLLATRGPPGTHDVVLAMATLDSLGVTGKTQLPRFDKGTDDRLAPETEFAGPADLILFEGWCVGARPQTEAELREPINQLERVEDSRGVWRTYVNTALAGPYQRLFARIHLQILFTAPGFEAVLAWRLEQERKLRARRPGAGQSDAEVARFVQFYERLTRHIAREMPPRADVVVSLGRDRTVTRIDSRLAR